MIVQKISVSKSGIMSKHCSKTAKSGVSFSP
jgi:hypothetical protein